MLTLGLAGLAAAATQTALGAGVSVAFGRNVHFGVEALAMVRLTVGVGSFADIPFPHGVALVQRARWEGRGRFGLATTARLVEARPAPPIANRSAHTGTDLAHWRAGCGITQRAAAERLGVAPSTVAKAELVPGKALGEQLLVALRGALAE
jgi:hypothetical protein